ncbi:MAG: thioesterase family protein, partial [Adlercreutzia sp.]|nr:thioesterase family protein [Adlercreutzia sp.]
MHVHTPIKVRYGETDMMGVVYHANYLLYFEDARIDFLDALDFSYAERIEGAGYMSPIHDIEIHYKAPLRYGEAGVVRTSVAKN